MARLTACLAALALVSSGGATTATAKAWDGGASAPQPAQAGGGLMAPSGGGTVAGAAQADPPEAQPPEGEATPEPVGPNPGVGAPDGDETPELSAPPPADGDLEVDIVVPLPGDPTAEQPPAADTTPVSTLPRTGQDTRLPALIALLLLAAGAGLRGVSGPARAASA